MGAEGTACASVRIFRELCLFSKDILLCRCIGIRWHSRRPCCRAVSGPEYRPKKGVMCLSSVLAPNNWPTRSCPPPPSFGDQKKKYSSQDLGKMCIIKCHTLTAKLLAPTLRENNNANTTKAGLTSTALVAGEPWRGAAGCEDTSEAAFGTCIPLFDFFSLSLSLSSRQPSPFAPVVVFCVLVPSGRAAVELQASGLTTK